jgi:hypothetical protein
MAKEFYTSGIGSAQTLNPSDESKIPIYDSLADAEADLANLEENQIVATKDKAVGELLHTVDTVEAGNMHPVTSNAVADAVSDAVADINARIKSGMASGTGVGQWANAINLGIFPAGRYQFIITPTNINTVALNTASTNYWAVTATGVPVLAPMVYFPDGTGTNLNLAVNVTAGVNYGINVSVIKVD